MKPIEEMVNCIILLSISYKALVQVVRLIQDTYRIRLYDAFDA